MVAKLTDTERAALATTLPHWRNEPIDGVQLRPRFQELRHHLWNQVRTEIQRNP